MCYLQVLWPASCGNGAQRAFADMDAWGYSFRLGTARAWFESDAADARTWLRRQVTDEGDRLTGACRG